MGATRRTFLRVLGATTVIAAAGAGYWASTRRPEKALEPWALAGGYDDPRMRALSYALLAPNSHNLQSWLVDLNTPDEATLYANPEKMLPMTDPLSRQITISMGCFLELLRIAAAEEGLAADVTPFPEGSDPERLDERPVARVRFIAGGERDPLFHQIVKRHTCKEPFDETRAVDPAVFASLAEAAATAEVESGGTVEAGTVGELRDLAWAGHEVEALTPRTLQESIDVMRIGRREIEANPDGIELGGLFLESLNLAGVLTRSSLADPASDAFAQGMEMYRAIIYSAQGFFWQITDDNSRATQLRTGRAWVRAQLKATEMGLTIHPLSQTLQEYPEMADLYEDVHRRLGARDGASRTVQMLARVGYGPDIDPTPRWRLEEKLI